MNSKAISLLAVKKIKIKVFQNSILTKLYIGEVETFMKVIIPILTAIIAGTAVFILFQKRIDDQQAFFKLEKLRIAEKIVQRNLAKISGNLEKQLDAFGATVANDKNFALRLIAENDRSSADVTEFAVRFREPMGFSVLEITDAYFDILSCGHFAANSGNSAKEKSKLTNSPVFFDDNIKGRSQLTLQSKVKFSISEIPFFVIGGLEINEQFLAELSPDSGITVLLKRGKQLMGKGDIQSISEVNNSRILINDKEYYAAELQLPFMGSGINPSLLIVLE